MYFNLCFMQWEHFSKREFDFQGVLGAYTEKMSFQIHFFSFCGAQITNFFVYAPGKENSASFSAFYVFDRA